MVVGGEAE